MRLRPATIAALCLTVLFGCRGEPPAPVASVRDSAGVRIVDHPEAQVLPMWRVAAEPEAVIGGEADEDPAHQFTEIRGAVRLSDGRLVVGDWGSKEARYYDANGGHLRTIGGAGEGPGELRFLYHVDRLPGDTLVLGGWPIGARYWFDERGDFIRNQALGPWFPGMLGRTMLDGSLLLDTYEFGSYGNTLERWAAFGPDEDLRPEGVVELVSREGDTVDTIAVIRGQTHHKTGELRVNFAMHALPFSPIGLVAWSHDRVFVGHTELPEVRAFDTSGALAMIVRWVPTTVRVTAADRRAFEDELILGLRNPDRAPFFRRWLLEIDFPETKPLFEGMISDEEGNLWVRSAGNEEDDEARWLVFGPDGVAIAVAALPNDLELLDVDPTHVVGRRTDAFGLETVYSYRIVR